MERFACILNKGFKMTFKNGLTISVQFGYGNYCSNKNYNADYRSEMQNEITTSTTAEIAIYDDNNRWLTIGNDQVKGYVSPNEVAEWIHRVSKAKNIKTIKRVRTI